MLSFRTALWGAWAIGLAAVAAASCGIDDSATAVTGGGGSGGATSSSTNPDVTSPTSTTTVSTSTQAPTSSTTSTQVGSGGAGGAGVGGVGGGSVGGGNVGGGATGGGGGATTGTGGSGGSTVTTTVTTTTTGTGGGSTCGNGVIDPGEECDAKGQAAGDCHLDCTLRGDPSICGSGVPQIDMNVGMTVAITGDTGTSTNDDVQPNNNSCGGDTGNELKYLVNVTGGGTLTATLTPVLLGGFGAYDNPVLDMIDACPYGGNNTNCCNLALPTDTSCSVQHTFGNSSSIYVVVDGNNFSHGAFTLMLTYN